MTKRLKLTKIELETKDGKRIELSLDEARELHDQLHELFGAKFIPSTPIIIERDRYPWPYTPRWIESPTTAPPIPGLPQVWCATRHNSGLNVTMKGDAV